ncbi:MAG TPA: LLM class flavin-dependent oxidoreductase [Actinomycetota bacterium]|jgi:alkanesulfonate monooxygenase SsuD/methylene tetrahydromethanopterin reductase-like flavin-dependent oxidoreductase (luciferase family)|nr:LLM class flavin-dependent oxidoreductase [Actinomycetota bacterium]
MPEPLRQPLGVSLRDAYPWPELAGLARTAEDAGFDALFLPEVGARDTLATLAALAGETSRLLLATGVVPLPSRSPGLLAAAAATVQERSGGRLILGLGTGPSVQGALDKLRATVGALRTAFAGGAGSVDGAPVRSTLPLPRPPEIWIAALGPRATRLAGEVADGVLLNWCTPERVAAAVTQVADGARSTDRDPSAVTVAVYVRAALTPGSLDGARAAAAEYGSYPAYARQFAAMGLDPADADAVMAAVVLTDRASATERLAGYRAAGADLPVVYPVLRPGRPSADAARTMIEAVAPA